MATNWRILGISGPKGGGKDTVFKMIETLCPLSVKRFAFADKLKNELVSELKLDDDILHKGTTLEKDTTLTGYTWDSPQYAQFNPKGAKTGFITYREMMCIWGEMKGTSYWVSKLLGDIYDYLEEDSDHIAIVTDVRYPEEVTALRYSGADLIKIEATSEGTIDYKHSSENTDILEYDYLLKGRGKASLSETKAALRDIMWSALGVNCHGK